MATLGGQGALPPVSSSLYAELSATTRRSFIPKLFVQLYYASPSLFYMMGQAQRSAGGLNQITIPIQGQSMVQGQFTGYGGGFNSPTIIPGIQNAQFSTAYWVVPVPLPFGETVIQATETVIPILKARMNDVYAVTVQQMARLMYTNNTGNSLLPDSFLNAFDNGTNYATYGGINRNAQGNTSWQGQYYNASSLTGGFTRAVMSQYLTQITDVAGGESPTYVVMNPGDFATLNNDFIGIEQAFINPGQSYSMSTSNRSSFPNLNVAGVPIFADHFCPKGSAFFVNCDYTAMWLSEDAAFDFSGFYSLVPLGQIGQQGVTVTGYEIATAKPVANAVITGFGGALF